MLRRAGILTLAALAVAGCSAGGTEPAEGEGTDADYDTWRAEADNRITEILDQLAG